MTAKYLPITPLAWMDAANCTSTDPEIFFPEKGGSVREGKDACAHCEVTNECLLYALANGITTGTWGGLSSLDRRRLRGAA